MCCRYLYSTNGVSSHIECDVTVYIHQAVCLQMYNEIPIFAYTKLCVFISWIWFQYLHTQSCMSSDLVCDVGVCMQQVVCSRILNVVPAFTYTICCVFRFWSWCRYMHTPTCVSSDFECDSGIYITLIYVSSDFEGDADIYIDQPVCPPILNMVPAFTYTKLCFFRYWAWCR
jgi:hypothetical protein